MDVHPGAMGGITPTKPMLSLVRNQTIRLLLNQLLRPRPPANGCPHMDMAINVSAGCVIGTMDVHLGAMVDGTTHTKHSHLSMTSLTLRENGGTEMAMA